MHLKDETVLNMAPQNLLIYLNSLHRSLKTRTALFLANASPSRPLHRTSTTWDCCRV